MGSPVNSNYGWGFGGFGQGTYGSQPIENFPIGYYLKIPTSQYKNSPQYLKWLAAALQILQDATDCLATFDPAFDLDNARGVQLDMLGQIVGADRTVPFQPSNGVSPILDDDTYRLLLKAKIAQNQWDGRVGSLQKIWKSLFPGGQITIVDSQNMTATIIVSGAFSSIIKDLISNGYIVPKKQTVQYNYSFSTLPIFGFSEVNDDFIAGFGVGHWS